MTLDTAEKLTEFWNSVENKPENDIKIKGLKKAVSMRKLKEICLDTLEE